VLPQLCSLPQRFVLRQVSHQRHQCVSFRREFLEARSFIRGVNRDTMPFNSPVQFILLMHFSYILTAFKRPSHQVPFGFCLSEPIFQYLMI
ncbi:MAG: hypothetical protein Q7U40_02045, partial [Desulfatirhabdiaceae bacterium]|nr:hypothetical protein [Desulfatirhabdiaceae bacterium]